MSRNKILLAAAYLIILALQLSNLGNAFFWDTTQLAADHANFFYSTGFSSWLLPDAIDSGHIPAFGFYIALVWKIFGRTLIASHLAMVPFAIGAVWQLYRLCRKFIPIEFAGIALLLVLADPTLLSQFTLVSPDVPLVFFFLLGTNAVLENRKYMLAIGAFFLFLTSMRGMMVTVCLLLLDLYCNFSFTDKRRLAVDLLKRSILYLPSLILFLIFNACHFARKGWIGYHKDSPWADCFAPVDFKGFLFNIGIYGWRLLDFGRIGIWLIFVWLVFRPGKTVWRDKTTRLLFLFALSLMVFLPANMLWAKNLLAHRYLIPIYLIFALLTAAMLFGSALKRTTKLIVSAIWLAVLVSGNFWIYPPKVAKGWDSTLAHLPYYKLRNQAIAYLEEQRIDFKDVQSFFPNVHSRDLLELNRDHRNFDNYTGQSRYVFYSNIYNLDDAVYDQLFARYRCVKAFENHGVYIWVLEKR
jgi:hypothetical protein